MVVICLCRAAEISFTTEAVRMLDSVSSIATRFSASLFPSLSLLSAAALLCCRRWPRAASRSSSGACAAMSSSRLLGPGSRSSTPTSRLGSRGNGVRFSAAPAVAAWRAADGESRSRVAMRAVSGKKLTDKIQAEYFSGLNYYLIGDGGGRGKDKMSDADTRITEDLRQTIDEFAKCFSDGLFTCSAGVFYTFNIMRLFGWRYAIAPYAYLAAATAVVDFIAPVIKTWRRLGRLRGQSWGSYRRIVILSRFACCPFR